MPPAQKYLDRHIPLVEYTSHGIRVRHPRRAEPPRPAEPAGRIRAIGRRARAAARHAPALRVEAPSRIAGGRLRGVQNRSTAPRLPTPARTADGSRLVASPIPAILVDSRRRARTPPGSD